MKRRRTIPTLAAAGLALVLFLTVFAAPAQAKFDLVKKWDHIFDLGGLATGPGGHVYVGEQDAGDTGFEGLVRKFTPNGKLVDERGLPGNPRELAVDPIGNLYMVGGGPGSDWVHKYDPNGTHLRSWGPEGQGDGEFKAANHIAVDHRGHVYVGDDFDGRIEKFTSDGAFLTKWGSGGYGDGQFGGLWSLAADPAGNVFASDVNTPRIQKFTSDGAFLTKWSFSADGASIATDAAGNLYASDHERVLKFGPNGQFLDQWREDPDPRKDTLTTGELAVGPNGNVYAADAINGRIYRLGLVPVTEITKGPKRKTAKRRARFKFRSDEPGSAFECKLDKRKWKPCESPHRVTKKKHLKPGGHRLKVRATVAGNRGKADKHKWRIK